MRILVLADEECPALWDYFDRKKLEGIDLIISCGDLKAEYLSFLVTFTSAPVLYIHGNHDERYEKLAPEGCVCIEDTVYEFNGVRILGLGGSMRYRYGAFQYTQDEMNKRVKKLRWKLHKSKGFDILVTHSPAYGVNDGNDLAHTGFKAFNVLLDKYRPHYFLHGHVHLNYGRNPRICRYGTTTVINGYQRYLFDYEPSLSDSTEAEG
jgi:Icc-related predicted phosphoesterase